MSFPSPGYVRQLQEAQPAPPPPPPPPPHQPVAHPHQPTDTRPLQPLRDDTQRAPVDLSDALSYFDLVKTHYLDFPDVYVRFLDVLTEFKTRPSDTPATIATIAKLFADSRELLEQLNDFLPPGYFVERGDADTNVVRLIIPGYSRPTRRASQWPDRTSVASVFAPSDATRWRNGDGLPWSPPNVNPEPAPNHQPMLHVHVNEDTSGLHLLGDLATRPSIASAAKEALKAKLRGDAQRSENQEAQHSANNPWSMATPSAALPELRAPANLVKAESEAMEIDDRHYQQMPPNYYQHHQAHQQLHQQQHIPDGYHQIRTNSTASTTTTSELDKSSDAQSPTFRGGMPRPRPTSTSSLASPRTIPTKISKRPGRKRSLSNASKNGGPSKPSAYVQQNSSRAFTCPFTIYGCTSTFGSKNEWKRHINTAHMRLGFWRCDIAPCDLSERKPNDFNRKDLFIQHVRRMHSGERDHHAPPLSKSQAAKDPEEQALNAAAARCYRHIRSTPEQSGCLFCDATFSGEGSWDERLEHVGRHMENAKKENDELIGPERWRGDLAMEEWLAREGLIVKNAEGEGWTLHEGASVN